MFARARSERRECDRLFELILDQPCPRKSTYSRCSLRLRRLDLRARIQNDVALKAVANQEITRVTSRKTPADSSNGRIPRARAMMAAWPVEGCRPR